MSRFVLAVTVLVCLIFVPASMPQSFPGVLAGHNDNGRTGQNLYETTLTPQNVNMTGFGKVFTYPVDGPIFAQPLYVPNVIIPNQGMHNVLYVATENDSVYAFDADGLTTTPLWQAIFVDAANGVTAVPCTAPSCSINPSIGITSTPVIDPSSATIYVLARTIEQGTYVQRLHALDLSTGSEKFGGPVVIRASVQGKNGTISFDPSGMQRAALLLVNGAVYIGWATSSHGWVMSYDAQTLSQVAILNTSPNGSLAGVWQSGAGLAADSLGYVYAATGDGLFDFNTHGPDEGDTVLKLDSNLSVVDYFTPTDQACRKANDYDLASSGPMLLPPQPGLYPDLMIQTGKGGYPCDQFGSSYAAPIYLIDSDSLGGYNPNGDLDVQTVAGAPAGYWSSAAYWQGPSGTYIYLSGVFSESSGDFLKMYTLTNGQLSATPVAQSSNRLAVGSTPSVSANGSTDGILWAIARQESLSKLPPLKPAVLWAYDATNVATVLYSSSQASKRDQAGLESKFVVPTI